MLGTAGHVDHGKTTLVQALTGIDTDRLKEEKERGLTIDLGFAHLELAAGIRAAVVDVPGHHDFLTNMLAGSTGIDAVLLVVSAQEGPMPQTREHLQITHLLGVEHGVVALTHIDKVDNEFAELAASAAAEEVAEITGHDWPVVPVDATSGEGTRRTREPASGAHRGSGIPASGGPIVHGPGNGDSRHGHSVERVRGDGGPSPDPPLRPGGASATTAGAWTGCR